MLRRCITCEGDGYIYDECGSYDYECPDCEDGISTVPENQMVFVNTYKVTRHFGGHEEGGWWYNWYECIESIPVRSKYANTMKEEAFNYHKDVKHGNIYSVLGGAELEVSIEEKPCERQTKERPYYE